MGTMFFFGQFYDVAKVAMIARRFSQLWLQTKYESKSFKTPFYIYFFYLQETSPEIWNLFLNFA
jgi:hypothetical protein